MVGIMFCAAGLGTGAASAAETWSLSCTEATPSAYCLLFESVLRNQHPDWTISHAVPGSFPELQLSLSEIGANALGAQLRWRHSETDWQAGPELEFSVMDEKMSESMVRKFFVKLVEHSKFIPGSE